jgi:hypothetical protein
MFILYLTLLWFYWKSFYILDIPKIEVPTTAPSLAGITTGPTLQCHASLQQSKLRPEVLILSKFECDLPK